MEIIPTPRGVDGVNVQQVVTIGATMVDTKPVELRNNVWLIGDEREVVIIDASHVADPILAAVGGRDVRAIVCTHGHRDHINVAGELRQATGAPIWFNPADEALWTSFVTSRWDEDLIDGATLEVAGLTLSALHTPGHTPGATCLHVDALTTVFTGDTLFQGGPGTTRFEYSSFSGIIESIKARLLTLTPETLVLTGHGPSTTIGTEACDLPAWVARGW